MFKIVQYEITSSRLPEEFNGLRMVHLSDLHGKRYGRQNRKLIKAIYEEKPDLVVMTGDMADTSRGAVSRLLELSRRLTRRYPVYFVMGNHEQALRWPVQTRLLRQLKKTGVILLDNTCRQMRRGQGCINLYGLATPMVYYKDPLGEYERGIHFSVSDAKKLLGEIDGDHFNILLAHNPLYYPSYRDWGADLTLSGHIHGGIIRIPGKGGLLSPDLTFFPKYDGGLFTEKGRCLVVSRGLGNHFLVRVRNPEELVVVTLRRQVTAPEGDNDISGT